MRAVRLYGVGDVRVEEVADPLPPQGEEVLVDVEAAGICGSDLHNYHTGQWISRVPSTPGHEFCAVVRALGDGARGLSVGERVVVDSRVFCRTCDLCRAGKFHLCRSIGYVGEVSDGGFAAQASLPARQFVRLPDQTVSPSVAALAEPLAVALHALNRLAPKRGQPVLVAGAGPIGALSALALKHRGLGPCSLIDRNEARLRLVSSVCGATPVDLATLAEETGAWRPYILDATGSAAVCRRLMDAVSPGGRLAVVGLFGRPLELDMNKVVEGELGLLGCAAFDHELLDAVELLAALAGDIEKLVSSPIALSEVPETYLRLREGRTAFIKAIIDPRKEN